MNDRTVGTGGALAVFAVAAAGLLLAACSGSGTSSTKGAQKAASGPGMDGDGGVTAPVKAGDGGAVAADAALSAPEQGVATYYAATGAGNCSFAASPDDLMVAAMDIEEYDNSNVCGECVRIDGPNATITVRIVDSCPDCETGHLDLSQQAFAMIADVSLGRVPITWEVVPCDVTGPLQYNFKDGSSQYWTAIQVLNSRLPIATLEWRNAGAGEGSWASVPRQSYDYFVVSSGVGTTGPFQVRVTASTGAQLVDTLPGVMADATVSGAAQFP